jgi:hypothetical protein
MANKNNIEKKTCFVACPIGEAESDERKRSDRVLRHILEPVLDELGYKIIRADQIQSVGRITTQVLQALNDADIVIADLTGENPNVMYELGIRHATQKPFIHIMESNNKPPFDIYDVRTIFYRLELDEVGDAKSELKGQIDSIERGDWSAISPITFVLPQASGKESEQAMITSLHQINNRMATDLLEMKEKMDIIGNIVSALHDTREQDREDKNNAMMIQLLTPMLTAAMQNPDSLQTLMTLSNSGQQEAKLGKQ